MTNKEKIERVTLMATGSPTWDLSPKDIEAIRHVLNDRAIARAALRQIVKEAFDGHAARIASFALSTSED